MDAVNRKILALLQEDGRLTVTELADKVGLSISPCHRRVRELERSGAIRGYRAVVDPEAVGLGFEAIVFITMRQEDRETFSKEGDECYVHHFPDGPGGRPTWEPGGARGRVRGYLRGMRSPAIWATISRRPPSAAT